MKEKTFEDMTAWFERFCPDLLFCLPYIAAFFPDLTDPLAAECIADNMYLLYIQGNPPDPRAAKRMLDQDDADFLAKWESGFWD